MPTSYQSPMRQDHQPQPSKSQGPESNLAVGTVRVSDLLQRKGNDVHTIRPQDTLAFAVERLSELRIGALVVTHSTGALAGILSERDVVRKIAEVQSAEALELTAFDVMTKTVETADEDAPLISLLRRMTEGRFRHMPVLDEDDTLVGMITIGDVVHHRLLELEHEALQLKQLIVG